MTVSSAERYKASGVDLDAAERAKRGIRDAVEGARSSLAFGGFGGFGGMVRIPHDLHEPVLVMSTDGVGTKVLVAAQAGRHDTVGEDLVNHCVNDILVHGARPLAFLDYIAAAEIDPITVQSLVEGVARGCMAHDMTLAGGETAAMPDLYSTGHYDLAGTVVGVVERERVIRADRVVVGDVLVGFAASGLHTNGYSLVRRVFFEELGLTVDSHVGELGRTVGEELLTVHRSYYAALAPVLDRLHGLAHITGGGIPGNLVRALPDGTGALVRRATWDVPAVFEVLQHGGRISRDEMFAVFNMGVGMIGIAPDSSVDTLIAAAATGGIPSWRIGEVVRKEGVRIE